MPYKLKKVPGKDLYWVVGVDGTKHSKEGLSIEMAKKQMTALNIAHARKEGHNIPKLIKYVKMPVDDYLSEHERLINLLEKAGKEGKKQRKEINDFIMK